MKLQAGAFPIGVFVIALLASTTAASAYSPQSEQEQAEDFLYQPMTGLVQAVREATAKYQDVRQAEADGYVPVLGCVSGAEQGAMGVHYLKASLLAGGAVDVAHPQLLVYEPVANGGLQLVAAEYLAIADVWNSAHANGPPPILMGQLFDYMDTPNRFGLPAFYSLHVWAWKYNPMGVFSMWNPRVSCSAYTGS